MRAWKVVRKHNGKLYSAFTTGKAVVEYKVGEPARPKVGGSKLFAFRTKQRAIAAAGSTGWYEVYPAEVKVSLSRYIPGRHFWESITDLKKLWLGKKYPIKETIDDWPNDTVFCDEITLLKREER